MVSFSGPSEARGGALVTLALDAITIASDQSEVLSAEQATGSCEYPDPFAGRAAIRCTARTEAGTFSAAFTSDGVPPMRRGVLSPDMSDRFETVAIAYSQPEVAALRSCLEGHGIWTVSMSQGHASADVGLTLALGGILRFVCTATMPRKPGISSPGSSSPGIAAESMPTTG